MTKPRYADVMKDGINYWTTSSNSECQHKNGWYITATFWIFKKRLFVCSDCGKSLSPND